MSLKSMVKKVGKSVSNTGKKAAKMTYGSKIARGAATLSGLRGVVKTTKAMKSGGKKR